MVDTQAHCKLSSHLWGEDRQGRGGMGWSCSLGPGGLSTGGGNGGGKAKGLRGQSNTERCVARGTARGARPRTTVPGGLWWGQGGAGLEHQQQPCHTL
jgi:hypothetical protein